MREQRREINDEKKEKDEKERERCKYVIVVFLRT